MFLHHFLNIGVYCILIVWRLAYTHLYLYFLSALMLLVRHPEAHLV